MVKVQAQSHFAKKVELDGYRFDSQKEATFYQRYVKPSGYKFECQKNFVLMDKYEGLGVVNLKRTAYKADFVIYNEDRSIKHVYDVKNGFSDYAIDKKAKLKFNMFARLYGLPVEVVVIRAHDFKATITGATKKLEPVVKTDVSYDWQDVVKTS